MYSVSEVMQKLMLNITGKPIFSEEVSLLSPSNGFSYLDVIYLLIRLQEHYKIDLNLIMGDVRICSMNELKILIENVLCQREVIVKP